MVAASVSEWTRDHSLTLAATTPAKLRIPTDTDMSRHTAEDFHVA